MTVGSLEISTTPFKATRQRKKKERRKKIIQIGMVFASPGKNGSVRTLGERKDEIKPSKRRHQQKLSKMRYLATLPRDLGSLKNIVKGLNLENEV